jgi:hypothetical protein
MTSLTISQLSIELIEILSILDVDLDYLLGQIVNFFNITSIPVRSRLFLPDTTANWTRIGLMATAAAAPSKANAASGAISAANGLIPPRPPPLLLPPP